MFDNTKTKGKKTGELANKALTAVSKFVIINCVLNPICHLGSFLAGFSEGFAKKDYVARID